MIKQFSELFPTQVQPLPKHRRTFGDLKNTNNRTTKPIVNHQKITQKSHEKPLNLPKFVSFFQKIPRPHLNCQPKALRTLPQQTTENKGKPTLVLDLDKTLIYSAITKFDGYDFAYKFGPTEQRQLLVYVQKRPFVDDFLKRCSEMFEIVVFTASLKRYAEPIIDQLDPEKKYIQHRLYRGMCLDLFGNYIKDLSRINRNLNSTVIIDDAPVSYCLHPQNGIHIKPFLGFDKADKELVRVFNTLSLISKEPNLVLALNNLSNHDKTIEKKYQLPKDLFRKPTKKSIKRTKSFPYQVMKNKIIY
ncbi:nli interacting factor-like phosphatase family protein [Anaeramoeba flamelloides]|uniref:Nli interacting factor-like phosphatase family protein n=1 Tax=Anaeramoeba flamelloides TaxID=1746091 RepID=A0AAV7YDD1_9EUKA|nr:nli interacting factor-like phosphatase family protein [Anaeramoeba flamelloides]